MKKEESVGAKISIKKLKKKRETNISHRKTKKESITCIVQKVTSNSLELKLFC